MAYPPVPAAFSEAPGFLFQRLLRGIRLSLFYRNRDTTLVKLMPEVQTAFYEGRLTVAHALEIARLQPRDQEDTLAGCFPGHQSVKAILKDRKAETASVRELREWTEREIHPDLKNTPFDAGDASLLPTAGACAACPKRTGNNPLLFPEIRNKSLCTDARLLQGQGSGPRRTAGEAAC
jgi:ParB family chromosome partitioning protein